MEEEVLKRTVVKTQGRAGVNHRHETILDEFQDAWISNSRKPHKRSIVKWLFGENCCTDNGGDCLDLFLFEIME